MKLLVTILFLTSTCMFAKPQIEVLDHIKHINQNSRFNEQQNFFPEKVTHILDSSIFSVAVYNWRNTSTVTYEYNEFDSIATRMMKSCAQTEWITQSRFVYSYNQEKLLDTIFEQELSKNKWRDHRREIFYYNNLGQLDSSVRQTLIGPDWKDGLKYHCTYNAEGLLVMKEYIFWQNNTWGPIRREEYEYIDKKLNSTTVFFKTNDFWEQIDYFKNEYDSFGYLIKTMMYDCENGIPQDSSIIEYTYNESGYLSEEIFKSFINNEFKKISRTLYIYDINNKLIEEKGYSFRFDVWKNNSKDEYHYNSKLKADTLITYSIDEGIKQSQVRYLTFYNNDDNVIKEITEIYKDNAWQYLFTYEYTLLSNSEIDEIILTDYQTTTPIKSKFKYIYNSENKPERMDMYEWDSEASPPDWKYVAYENYTYDLDGNKELEIVKLLDKESGEFFYETRNEFSYDEQHNCTEKSEYKMPDKTGSNWVHVKTTYSQYDENNHNVQNSIYEMKNNQVTNSNKFELNYNDLGLLTEEVGYYYDTYDEIWKEDSRTKHYYSTITGIEENHQVSKNSISFFPNPATDMSNITISLSSDDEIELYVTDLSGRTISTIAKGFYSTGSHDFAFYSVNLPTGFYLINLKTKDGIITYKVQIIK